MKNHSTPRSPILKDTTATLNSWKSIAYTVNAFCLGLASVLIGPQSSLGQSSGESSVSVPRLIKYAGTIENAQGTVAVTFSLYADQVGGESLWQEIQNVELDRNGHYSVYLGASYSDGMPVNMFSSGAARWLGITVQGQQEQPRILLVSVPYAVKAGDADTLGGKPLSAFVLADSANNPTQTGTSSDAGNATTASTSPSSNSNTLTPIGKTRPAAATSNDYPLPVYDSANNLSPSSITSDSTGTNLFVPNAMSASTVSGTVGSFGDVSSTGYLKMTNNTAPTLAPEVHLSGYSQSWLAPGIDVFNSPSTDLVLAGMMDHTLTKITDLIYMARNKAGDGTVNDDSGFPTLGIFCTPPSSSIAVSICNSPLFPERDLLHVVAPQNFSGNYLRFDNQAGTPVVTFNGTGTNLGSDFQISVFAKNGSPNPVLQTNGGTTLTVGDNSYPAYNWGGTLSVVQATGGSVAFGNASGNGFFSADGGGVYLGSSSGKNMYFKPGDLVVATVTTDGNFGIGTSTPGAMLEVNGTALFDQGVTFQQPVTFPSFSVVGTGQATINGHLMLTNLPGASILGTDSSGNLINNSSATLSNNISGNAATATSAAIAVNLASGTTGAIPYQAGSAATAMLNPNPNATDEVVVSHGTGTAGQAPMLSNAPALSMENMTGVPPSMHGFSVAGQYAAYSGGNWFTLYTTSSATTQLWRLSATLMQDSSVTCSSYGTASIGFEWTDARGVMQTSSTVLTFAVTPAGGFPVSVGPSGPITLSPNSPIQVSVQYTPGSGCSGNGSTYTASAVAEQLL